MASKGLKATFSVLVALGGTVVGPACGHTVEPGEIGMKYHALRNPGLEDKLRPERFYFQWVWNDVITYDVTLQSRDENIQVLTKDDLHVPVIATVTFKPDAEQLYELHTTIGKDYYEEVIGPTFVTLVRAEFSEFEHNDLARDSLKIEAAILARLRKSLSDKPLKIDAVAIKHISYDAAVTQAISRKLTIQQQSEQKKFELQIAEDDAEIARTRARGIADAVFIRAKGDAQATVVKGKAQGEAQESITKTLTKEYLQYKAFDGTGTTYYFVPVGKDGLPIIVNAEPKRNK